MTESTHSGTPSANAGPVVENAVADIFEAGRIRLQTLVLLRWLAVAGQAGAVVFTAFGLGFELPIGFCLGAIAASAWLNIVLTLRYPMPRRLGEIETVIYLGYDLLQLAVLLYLTGGLENPFAFLFLVPVTISATALSLRATVALAVFALLAVSMLAVFHMPLPWFEGEAIRFPELWTLGMWSAITLGLAFMTAYAYRVAREARRMSAALSATQLVLAREQRLSALDGLAAAAAHELGTPLATIVLVAKELRRDAGGNEAMREDLELLQSQAERCREILARLSRRGEEGDAMHARMNLAVLLDESASPFRGKDVEIEVTLDPTGDSGPAPELTRKPEILFGLRSLIENATAFARSRVTVAGRWTARELEILVADDGPGFPPEVLDKLGEPYVSSRRRLGAEPATTRADGGGMGLGFFIAKTLLERSGARVIVANRVRGHTGAVVRLVWPRSAVETLT